MSPSRSGSNRPERRPALLADLAEQLSIGRENEILPASLGVILSAEAQSAAVAHVDPPGSIDREGMGGLEQPLVDPHRVERAVQPEFQDSLAARHQQPVAGHREPAGRRHRNLPPDLARLAIDKNTASSEAMLA